ncbi:type IV secretory system conjugative DNA transfer family protein, partial [Azohydromonas australica]|uniref:type IV secretory system conjugative DNA transfer family protein n=1 Tax=Azohydromonas australica TaxID=364039 RepID=UPI0004904EA3
NMRVLIICQSESQVAFEYGKDTAKTIRTAMGMQVLFPPKEQEDAEQYSRMLDNCTEKVRNRNSSTGKGGHSTGTSEQQQKRPLMLPQEIKRLPDTKQIIVMEQCLPILCGRANYDQDPELNRRSKIAPPDVAPLDLDTHVARINECVRDLQPGEGEKEPLPAALYAHDFKAMPPMPKEPTDADRERYADGFFDTVRDSVVQQAEPEDASKPKPARKKAAGTAKPRKKKAAPASEEEANFAAAYAAAEAQEDIDLSGLPH